MKKKLLSMVLTAAMAAMLLAGCGQAENPVQPPEAEVETGDEQAPMADAEIPEAQENDTDTEAETGDVQDEGATHRYLRVGGLKGPTTMGLVKLLDDAKNGETEYDMEFTLAGSADELTPKLIQGELDMAAVPCNLAAVLYQKTEGEIRVLCTNTLGVLSIVDTGDSVQEIADLKGKTIYATGQGTTPEYTLKKLLAQSGLDPENDVTIEWKSEATEVVAVMTQSDEEIVAMLPQPFVTVAMTQVEGLREAVNFNDAWNASGEDSKLVTGVLVARKSLIEEQKDLVDIFLDDYQASCEFANTQPQEAATLIGEMDIVKAAIAEKALPKCNITYLEGDDMKTAVSGYLQVLYDAEPKSVGGALPGDDFYYKR